MTNERYSEEHIERYSALVLERLEDIRARVVAAGRDPDSVRVVGVTKTFGADAVIAADRAGIVDIGENYADELVLKARLLETVIPSVSVKWHFLGGVQRNKINRLRGIVGLFQGIDRFEEGEALAKRSPGASVLVEVDTTHTPGRGGVIAAEVPSLVARLRTLDLHVEGLMTVAPAGGGETATKAFREVANLRKELGLREASMGMSEDLELAVAEGSTMVRIGRALFGPRPQGIQVSQ